MANPRRQLPSVDRVLREPAARELAERAGHEVAVAAIRRVVADERALGAAAAGGVDGDVLAGELAARAARLDVSLLRPVINATGVIVHTNLGRAPLAEAAIAAAARVAGGYANLELDLASGERGSRQDALEPLLRELTGAEAGIAVANNAAALHLIVSAHAAGREVVVSRGQLVEIGDGFRIPEILAASGARVVEVGTTNRTSLRDYERALGPDTGLLLRVHPSNYRVVGFTEEVSIAALAELGARAGVPVVDDLGSGLLRPDPLFEGEPVARASVAAGAALACFSGDKLLGGPQAGLIIGTTAALDPVRRHPLARAVRIGKLAAAALEATLRLHRDPDVARREIPVLRMAHAPLHEVRGRAEQLAAALGGELAETAARIGGGALPTVDIASFACALPDPRGTLHAALRTGSTPVLGRLEDGRLLLDARTLRPADVEAVVAAVRSAHG